ncbi:hypothetical protein ACFL0M_08560 [Thermodesulfobacteriota bacterium]
MLIALGMVEYFLSVRFSFLPAHDDLLIAALTREHGGWEQAGGLGASDARSRTVKGDVGAESSLRMHVEIRIWFFANGINRFTHEVLTPKYPATFAPENPNSLSPNQNKNCLAFKTLCLRLSNNFCTNDPLPSH